MDKGVEKTWGELTVFEIWLFCTAFYCEMDINDGTVTKVTCRPRSYYHEH